MRQSLGEGVYEKFFHSRKVLPQTDCALFAYIPAFSIASFRLRRELGDFTASQVGPQSPARQHCLQQPFNTASCFHAIYYHEHSRSAALYPRHQPLTLTIMSLNEDQLHTLACSHALHAAVPGPKTPSLALLIANATGYQHLAAPEPAQQRPASELGAAAVARCLSSPTSSPGAFPRSNTSL